MELGHLADVPIPLPLKVLETSQYFIPLFHSLRTQRAIKFRSAKIWNAVPDNLKCVNFYRFILKSNNIY